VMTNPLYVGIVKIGYTQKNPHERAKELSSSSGVPESFSVAFSQKVESPSRIEFLVHNALAEFRTNNKREFFRIGVSDAEKKIREIVEQENNKKANKIKTPLIYLAGKMGKDSYRIPLLKGSDDGRG